MSLLRQISSSTRRINEMKKRIITVVGKDSVGISTTT